MSQAMSDEPGFYAAKSATHLKNWAISLEKKPSRAGAVVP
jgi:hypothetical protein